MPVTNKIRRTEATQFKGQTNSAKGSRLAPVDCKEFFSDHDEDNFNHSSGIIIGALSSKTPVPSSEYAHQYAAYNAHLNSLAQRLLVNLGLVSTDAAAKAVEQFHLDHLFGGFQEFVLSGEKCFLPTAVKAMRRICMTISQDFANRWE